MNTNIVLSLDTRRKKNDGTYPIILRLGHNGETTGIPTGYSVKEKDWDEKAREVKSSYKGILTVARLNNLLQKQKTTAKDTIVKLHDGGVLEGLSLLELRARLKTKNGKLSFIEYGQKLIDELKSTEQFGTARCYRNALDAMKRMNGGKDVLFANVTYNFLTKFETWYMSKEGNEYNGLSVYLRSIRAIYNKAAKAKLIDKKESYPFEEYKIRSTDTEKRALDPSRITKLIKLKLKPGHECFDARNYFVASFMMYGMNHTDFAYLKKTDLVDGRIRYQRAKPGKWFDIKITPQLNEIISYYLKQYPDSEFVFPIIKRETALDRHNDIRWSLQTYNDDLQKLAKLCGIETRLTSYVSRHTFATHAMMNQVPVNVISAMLGHKKLTTTQVYLKSLPSTILDDFNSKIVTG